MMKPSGEKHNKKRRHKDDKEIYEDELSAAADYEDGEDTRSGSANTIGM